MRDSLTPFVIEGAAIRGALGDLSQTTSTILGAHDYPPALARAMTELLAAAALMASTLKLKGSLVVQMSGDGPVRLLVVECNDALELRATAQWSADAQAKFRVSGREFDVAWSDAVKETSSNWDKPGAPAKSSRESPR